MPPTRTRAGIVHQSPGQTLESLPLEEVVVKAWIVDVSARIILKQVFSNPSDRPTGRAKYVFPLPASAAVCAFELEHEDGRVIVGVVKDKDEAAFTFDNAEREGRAAALVELVTDDTFTISVGSIPATQRVTACITFVMDLLDEGIRDHVRLQLPVSIAERYGTPPPAIVSASSASSHTRLQISVDIQTSDVIHAIKSPTHPILIQRYKTSTGRKSQRRMSTSWKSDEFLAGDFVVTVHADGVDRPRCFAEVRTEDGGAKTIAMQLTLVPAFQLPRILSQEYIFVIDRSGSMGGAPIETAKRTLTMLIRCLPSKQTVFNIISFGSEVDGLWSQSMSLDQISLQRAISHVQGMGADYGGTEIGKALQFTLHSRTLDRPAVVFVLTDGDVHDNINPISVVATSVQLAPPGAPLRVFVLGIGTEVSSDMCERLARAGNGECLFALSAESIVGKCARLLNAGRTKNIEKIEVKWGDAIDASNPQVAFSPSRAWVLPVGIVELAPPPLIQQAPQALTRIFTGMRFTVFAITSLRSIPKSVRLLIKLDGVDEPLEHVVSVTDVKPFRSEGSDFGSEVSLVHSLAARKLITEVGDRRGDVPVPAPAVAGQMHSEDELRKAEIIRLGLEYQLVSKYTSFVAVESGDERMRTRGGKRDTDWIRSRRQHPRTQQKSSSPEDPNVNQEPGILKTLGGIFSSFFVPFGFFGGPLPPTTRSTSVSQSHPSPNLPGAYVDSDTSLDDAHSGRLSDGKQSHYSADTFSTLSSLEGSSSSSCWTNSRSPSPVRRFIDPIERAPSPSFMQTGAPQQPHNDPLPGQSPSHRQPVTQEAYYLFSLQEFDGSFPSTSALEGIVGAEILGKAVDLGVETTMWATAVAVAYLKAHMGGEPDLLDALLEKVKEFVESSGDERTFEELVRRASGLLASSS